ncbi:MAG: YaiI/YqxD family protein [Myxococcales bacterium]|nr:YaiI/YqxD family protein [Myxococcales bacterium]
MSTTPKTPTIWIDGDAAPKTCKAILYKASGRTHVPIILVANRAQDVPRHVKFIQVPGGMDVADDYIADHCQPGDLVISADIPLAARIIEAGGTVLQFRGEPLTEENVRQRLAMRDFMDTLRGGGIFDGGPPPYGKKDTQRFANALDRWLARNG